jgi:hypothetical protein
MSILLIFMELSTLGRWPIIAQFFQAGFFALRAVLSDVWIGTAPGERANVQSGSDAVNGGLGLLLSGTVKRGQL